MAKTIQNFQHGELTALVGGLEPDTDALQLAVFGFGYGQHPLQPSAIRLRRQGEISLQTFQVSSSRNHSRWRAIQNVGQLARGDLVQIGVIQPQGLAVRHDALLERLFVNELEAVRPQKFERAAGGFGLGSLPFFGRAGHDLGEGCTAALGCFDKAFQALQPIFCII